MDGILGLAYDSISVNNLKTFVTSSNLVDKSFAFYLHLDTEKSYMTIPSYDPNVNEGQFRFHNVVEKKYFSLNLTGIKNGNTNIDASGYKAVIDSGTSVLVGPTKLVNELNKGININLDCSGAYDNPDIAFQIDGIDYVLTPQDYVLKITQNGVTQCQNSIMGQNFGPLFKYFILGDTFMRRYYSYFDMNTDRVGFIDATTLSLGETSI
jgi:cathepsin D